MNSSSYLNISAKAFVPGGSSSNNSNNNDDGHSFNPFEAGSDDTTTNDDSILQLSEHLISSDLLDDDYDYNYDVEREPEKKSAVVPSQEGTVNYSQYQTPPPLFVPFQNQLEQQNQQQQQQDQRPSLLNTSDFTTSSTSPLKNIWDAPATTRQSNTWDSFEPYSSYEDENEFDPTLQYFNDGYYDAATIQDMHKLSLQVTNPSAEEEQAENVGEDMSTLQMLQTIFSDLNDEELLVTLESYDYDMDRAIESLLISHTTTTTINDASCTSNNGNDNNVNSNNNNASLPTLSTTQSNTTSSSSSNTTTATAANQMYVGVKKRQVCRHFLAGECYRKDCWFVHDLSEKVCKFWLQGLCLKGDSCEFSHIIDIQQVADKIISPPPTLASSSQTQKQKEAMIDFNEGDYPELISSKKKLIKSEQKTTKGKVTLLKTATTTSTTTTTTKEYEFPSLSEAIARPASKANAKKQQQQKPVVNFATIASKNKDQPTTTKKKSGGWMSNGHSNTHHVSVQKLRTPVQIPWLETGSSLHSVYMKERKLAIEYGMLRNRFFRKAADFYQKGDGTKAKLYSMEAHKYNRLMREMHTEASQRIFEQRSKNEAFIDLHGLHQDEALDIIDERLCRMRGHYEGVIYIVTGTGHHSGAMGLTKKQSKLKPCVENYLKQENYRFAETNIIGDSRGGVFAVDLSS